MSRFWNDTNYQTLKDSDYVIFIGKENYEFCKSKNYPIGKYVIWEIPDFDDSNLNEKRLDKKTEIKLIEDSEKTFSDIKKKVDQLAQELQSSGK